LIASRVDRRLPRRLVELSPALAILAVAAVLRIWGPWNEVFGGPRVNFLETDAWYHLRLIENQLRNFPHAIHFDPFVSPSGRAVAVAPLFDTLISAVVFFTRGSRAPAAYIEGVAALAPAFIGVLAVASVIGLTTRLGDRRGGLAAGAVAALSPGHFLERTLAGYVDHHALEVLLALATLIAVIRCLPRPDRRPKEIRLGGRVALPAGALVAGLLLGLYLLTWGSGAYLVAILALWIVLSPFVGGEAAAAARATAVAAVVALLMVVTLQDPGMYRFETQLASLLALLVCSLLVVTLAGRVRFRLPAFVGLCVAAALGLFVLAPGVVGRAAIDLARFRPDPMRMAVLEARPLFLYSGSWQWLQPWTLFRVTFYLGLVGLAWLVVDLRRTRRLDHLLVVVFTAVTCAATIGQNRFGYYLVPANAVVIGWLVTRVLVGIRRPLAVGAVFVAVALVPGVGPAVAAASHRRGMPDHWAQALGWLRAQTPEPFWSDDYYLARYDRQALTASYTVMNWWDQGYWLVQGAHRVPVTDPTQDGAGNAASFYTATDEASATAVLKAARARYVLADAELPFRGSGPAALAGKFQGLLDWAGLPSSRFYELCFARLEDGRPLQPLWIFREAYYQTMAFRLTVLGGRAAPPAEPPWLVELRQRRDADGRPFCEVASAQAYPSVDEAKLIAAQRGGGFEVVGLNPSRLAFPVAAVGGLRQIHQVGSARQPAALIRIFEVTP
jgi:dolichyl-diphosphooligosaccharide--protein glycosyltransferase